MSLESNTENRNTNQSVRCCSFCRRAGHTINRCNSEPIRIFERNIIRYIAFNRGNNLREYLLNEALTEANLVRAFAIRRCGANTRSNMVICIDLIIQYFMSQTQYIETNNQTIEESQPVEEEQTPEGQQQEERGQSSYRRRRRFGFSMPHSTIESESILHGWLFMLMMRSINASFHGSLHRKFNIKTKILQKDNLNEKCECSICYDEYEKLNFVKLDCGHEFCKDCIKKSLQNEVKEIPCCAFCRSDIKNLEVNLESIKNEFNELIINEI